MLKNGRAGYCSKDYLTPKGTPTPAPSTKLYFINSVDSVTVYASPSDGARALGKLKGGTVVKVLAHKSPWGYIEVYNTGKRGYLRLGYLKKY